MLPIETDVPLPVIGKDADPQPVRDLRATAARLEVGHSCVAVGVAPYRVPGIVTGVGRLMGRRFRSADTPAGWKRVWRVS